MFSHLCLECVLWLLLPLLTRSLEEGTVVDLGQNTQLPCTYSLPTTGSFVPVCWGSGACPAFDCSNLILRIHEKNVTYMASRRYTLERDFHKGDVSLTITNVTLDDSGTYCCRVRFPGPFNDGKFNIKLVIRPIKFTPTPTAQRGWTPTLPRMLTTKGRGPETQTSGMHHEKNQIQIFTLVKEFQASGATTRLGVYITARVGAVVALKFIIGALTLLWYFHRKKNSQNASLITLASSLPSGLTNAAAKGIRSQEKIYTIEENVYTTEENVYEVEDSSDHSCSVNSRQPE